MKSLALAGMSLAALLAGSAALQAKTLVYCSEGSPENFSPALNTTGTSFDAARPVYNKLTEFERGSTKVVPGLAGGHRQREAGKHGKQDRRDSRRTGHVFADHGHGSSPRGFVGVGALGLAATGQAKYRRGAAGAFLSLR